MQLPSHLTIRVTSGKSKGYELSLQHERSATIGRDAPNDVVLDDRGVSRQHCRIFAVAEGWQIEDLNSTNGVVLRRFNAAESFRVTGRTQALEHGDELEIGDARLRLTIVSALDRTEILPLHSAVNPTVANTAPIVNPMKADRTTSPDTIPQRGEISNWFSVSNSSGGIQDIGSRLPYQFHEYKLHKKIGEGGMGEVFLASKTGNTEGLAIKFLRLNRETTQQDHARFMREIEICMTLSHPAIIPCIGCGEEHGRPYIVMPYCSAGNLADVFARIGKLNLRRSLRLIDRLLGGLEHAHDLGIVHRDLKPSNILLHQSEQGKYVPHISDFGLAKSYLLAGDSGMTVNGSVGGSWVYMPKEQLTNFRFVSPQSDVWSLGVILYECLTQRLPRPHTPMSDPIKIILESNLVPIEQVMPSVPESVSEFLGQALAIDLASRFQDARQMRRALHFTAQSIGVDL